MGWKLENAKLLQNLTFINLKSDHKLLTTSSIAAIKPQTWRVIQCAPCLFIPYSFGLGVIRLGPLWAERCKQDVRRLDKFTHENQNPPNNPTRQPAGMGLVYVEMIGRYLYELA